MPELRKDPISRRWVIIATERAARPTDFPHEEVEPNDASRCPFCEGRETQTPPEIFAIRRAGTARDAPGWRVRVVPNKFPALRIEGRTDRSPVGIYTRMDGVGAHEVIIETTEHHTHLGLLPVDQVADVIRAYLHRYRDLKNDPRFEYALLFRNHGRTAGASLSHPHSQLIALPIVPNRAAQEVEAAERYFGRHGRCIYCAMLEQELAARERVVWENEHFAAIAPYASRFPFETWLVPKAHEADFGALRPELEVPLAGALQEALLRLHRCLQNPPYNFIIHTLPYREETRHAYHWHLEITPRLTQVAGFEWGSGFYINTVVPEDAARYLREVGTNVAVVRAG
ncbi:MAG: galactose-1-phosphate uridylyltransferase [Armatimonadota bacterium]|nr:galactose-1-phosphate uridylyltransferase [Armatimonadota bacterium]MDR7452701.1 galactose-1-phosphate uridylyltransferase [Armatimonadota bacterium]MDR7467306.1 galactose-1-phosphate uridylyltransferase [Armatimonadota bacterium]MDR7494567.1 galactose-1-phosphate uridylyltransferase [Armatimonadota bacterium]MDR7504466.1 galactose-1-phosphate uridylyltransferase [Armatimonadota bacterium]